MGATLAKLSYAYSLYPVISHRLFGGKMSMLNGPSIAERYTSSMDYLGISSVRIGGEVNFDVTRPDVAVYDNLAPNSAVYSAAETVSIFESLAWAQQQAMPMIVTVPSRIVFSTPIDPTIFAPRTIDPAKIDEIKAFVENLLKTGDGVPDALPDAPIDAIELGNEYWTKGMTSAEYGRAANTLALAVQDAMDELGIPVLSQPKIIVQMGSPYAREFSNDFAPGVVGPYAQLSWSEKIAKANADIISQISSAAKDAIDGLVEHYYHNGIEDTFYNSSDDLRYLDVDLAQWAAAGYKDKDIYITEWNNKQDLPFTNYSQYGLKGAGVMVEQMENMLRLGVDAANVWPFQHRYTRLVDGLPSLTGTPEVTPRGEIFRLMSEALPGTRLLESNLTTALGQAYELNAFASRDKYVFFVTSRSATAQTINLNLSEVVTSYIAIDGVKVGFDPATSDGQFDPDGDSATNNSIVVPGYQDPDALALLTTLTGLGTASNLNLTLGAYEIARLTFTVAPKKNMYGTAENDTLTAGAGHDSILGNSGNDVLNGLQGDDTLKGGDGNDTLNGGTGNNYLDGGANTDTLIYSTNSAITLNLGRTTAQNTGEGWHRVLNFENVTTGNGHDVLTGNSFANVITTQNGNDRIYGGAGDDTVNAGSGNDLIDGGSGIDTAIFQSGVAVSINLLLSAAQNTGEGSDTLRSIENLMTGTGNDTITGNDGANGVQTGAGNDVISAGAGADFVDAGSGDDRIIYTSGADTVIGGFGVDTLVFYAPLAGSVNLISGANGHGMVLSGIENLTGGSGADRFSGNGGGNVLTGNAGNDDLRGNGGRDSLFGGDGQDLLMGGDADDFLSGGAGNDSILGQTGADRLTGGGGDDLFRYQNPDQGADVITDFRNTAGDNDRFSIYASGFGGGLVSGSLNPAKFVLHTTNSNAAIDSNDRFIFNAVANSLWFDVDGTGSREPVLIATLLNLDAPNLTAEDIWLF